MEFNVKLEIDFQEVKSKRNKKKEIKEMKENEKKYKNKEDKEIINNNNNNNNTNKSSNSNTTPNNNNNTSNRNYSERFNQNITIQNNLDIQLNFQEFYSISFEVYNRLMDQLKFSNIESELICKGFVNSGNTCFVNCVLQSFLSIPRIIRFISEFKELCPPSRIPNDLTTWSGLIGLAMQSYVTKLPQPTPKSTTGSKKIMTTSSTTSPFINPCSTEFLGRSVDIFRRDVSPMVSSQADAMEYLTYLLDSLHEELVIGKHPLEFQIDRDDEITTSLKEDDGWEEVGRGGAVNHVDQESRKNAVMLNNSTIISCLFHGTLRSEVRYASKKATSVSFQRFHCLSLDISSSIPPSPSSSLLDIYTALEIYFREETVSNARISKKVTLESIPPVLILQLKRFSFHRTEQSIIKIKRDVSYPAVLTLSSQYLSPSLQSSLKSPLQYHLHAIIMHHGNSADGGHYTTLCRGYISSSSSSSSSNIQWRHIDDTNITNIPTNRVLTATSEAYILFYSRE